MKIVEYNGAPQFERFVVSTFCNGSGVPARDFRWMIKKGARIVVAIGDSVDPDNLSTDPDNPDPFYGWAAAHNGVVIWVYTKLTELQLPSGDVWKNRGRHLAKLMLACLGFTKDKEVPVLYDTVAARKWAQRGWKIVFPEEQQKESA